MLKTVTGKNRWCGPAAMAAITGFDTDYCAYELSKITGRRVIKGVWPNELCKALFRMGYHAIEVYRRDVDRITLNQWLKRDRDPEGVYLVFITGHYIVVRGKQIIDNRTKTPIWYSRYPRLRKRVIRVWRVEY